MQILQELMHEWWFVFLVGIFTQQFSVALDMYVLLFSVDVATCKMHVLTQTLYVNIVKCLASFYTDSFFHGYIVCS